MNFDLIIKLAKLANNNPNDHEANAAARKVCRLLAEANFKFEADRPTQKPYQAPQTPPRPTRKAEPEKNPFSGSHYNTPFDQAFRDAFTKGTWNIPFEDGPKKKEDFLRKCIKCGLEIRTYYKGNQFVCRMCRDKIKNVHECPDCKSHDWLLSVINNSYFCTFCSYEINQVEADKNGWRMK